jgi:hypothetical protein
VKLWLSPEAGVIDLGGLSNVDIVDIFMILSEAQFMKQVYFSFENNFIYSFVNKNMI